ncbi:MAG: hypothetical protein CMJ01_01605 [Pelagibacteraceae bacterium]|nr:hypothetical protein [Pelagibacteraceae bacterium]
MNKHKFLYKKIGPLIGNFLDKLFFTDFGKRANNFYHKYNQNDYTFDKDKYCFIHVPRTGGWSFKNYFANYNLPLYVNDKGAHHNPISILCSPKEYNYVTIIRDPIDRVYSHYQMFIKAKEISSRNGLINFLRYSSEVKNLYCQYYSGLIGETVDDRIFKIALENLKNFKAVINFNNYDDDLKLFLKKMGVKEFKKDSFYINKIDKTNYSNAEREAIKLYNYWDLKLYKEFNK